MAPEVNLKQDLKRFVFKKVDIDNKRIKKLDDTVKFLEDLKEAVDRLKVKS